MTVVLVHGNPETDDVWDLLSTRLADLGHTDQVRLSPPASDPASRTGSSRVPRPTGDG